MVSTPFNSTAFRDMESLKDSNKGPSNSLPTPNTDLIQHDEAKPFIKPPKPNSKNREKQKILSLNPLKMKAKAERQPNANST